MNATVMYSLTFISMMGVYHAAFANVSSVTQS
jgi:hypothetical protein